MPLSPRSPEPVGDQPSVHVVGTGSYAVEISAYAVAAGFRVAGLVELLDPARIGTTMHGLPVVGPDAAVVGDRLATVGMAGERRELWSRLEPHGWTAATIVHPAAEVGPGVEIGAGCIVGPLAVLGACARLDDLAHIGRGVLVGHHVTLGAGVIVYPGGNIGGNTAIGSDAFIGMGATVLNGLTVGAGAVVAAGSLVLGDVPDGVRVQGVPARAYAAAET